eukprot:TRINITY_DN18750_c0_g1_i1.p1 TRINITY_DN18750_c0_g1~~TRINITY_DN18750_c0_g1_i1.p1  ORF type:complete len:114 (-),score=5.84 TRINITY_DN18750_c0_g1_i1:13-354(-)
MKAKPISLSSRHRTCTLNCITYKCESVIMAKVSIIIPTYNCLDYLPKAIGSVLKQTHQDVELIIIDDNSNDGTSTYLASIDDERIITLSTLGVGAPQARNLGIEKATGEYTAF